MTIEELPAAETEEPFPMKYVAFCDVLGFSHAVENDFSQTIQVYKAFQERMSDWPFPESVKVSIYSDSILLVCDSLPPLLYAVQGLWFATLAYDWLIRGGIAYGKYWEDRSNGNLFVVSDALVRAVRIESTVKHPCVALSPEVEIPLDAWFSQFEHGLFAAPLLHHDGLNVVNPFNTYWFASACNRVTQMKTASPQHSDKYDWFLGLAQAVQDGPQLIPEQVISKMLELKVIAPIQPSQSA